MSKMPHAITWNGILTARDNSMQAWSDQINSRDMHSMFSNKHCSANLIMSMLHNFHLESFRDQFLTLQLISLHHEVLSKNKIEESSNVQKITMQLEPSILEGNKFHKLMSTIDDAFKSAIKRTCASFCELSAFLMPIT